MSEQNLKGLTKEDLIVYLLELQNISQKLLRADSTRELLPEVVKMAMDYLRADGGSLYLLTKPAKLKFETCINRSFNFKFNPSEICLKTKSIVTYAFNNKETLMIEDVYLTNSELPYEFNHVFDEHFNYRTKSTIVAPLIAENGRTIGVLQLFNRKNYNSEKWPAPEDQNISEMPAFGLPELELLKIFANLAASTVEKYVLSDEEKAA
jgi:GAF domain-containing protein